MSGEDLGPSRVFGPDQLRVYLARSHHVDPNFRGSAIYGQAGSVVRGLVISGSATQVAHQLVDVMSIATDESIAVEKVVDAARETVPDFGSALDALVEELRGQSELQRRMYILAWLQTLIAILTFLGLGQGEVSTPPPEQTVIVQQMTEVHNHLIQVFIRSVPESDVEPTPDKPDSPAPGEPRPGDESPPPRPQGRIGV